MAGFGVVEKSKFMMLYACCPLDDAVFPHKMQFVITGKPPLYIPPPSAARLEANVQLVTAPEPVLYIPPPSTAQFELNMQFVTVPKLPLYIPPPKSAEFSLKIQFVTTADE